MGLPDLLARELPQPAEEGEGLVAKIFVELTGSIGQGILDDVRGIHARRQPAIEPDRDHPTELVAVAFEQVMASRVVALACALDQVLRRLCCFRHHRASSQVIYLASRAKAVAKEIADFVSGSGTEG